MEILQLLGMILAAQGYAPYLLADFPNLRHVELTSCKHRPRGLYDNSYESRSHSYGPVPELKEEPEQLILRGVSSRGSWVIGIDLERSVVGIADWDVITGEGADHLGSAAIGVLIFGIPGILVTLPLQIPLWGIYGAVQACSGMSTHTAIAWWKLRNQIPEKYRAAVRSAILNIGSKTEQHYFNEKYAAAKELYEKETSFATWGKTDTFMHQLSAGTARPSKILSALNDWQYRPNKEHNVKQHEWVGMTEEEFSSWEKQEKTVVQILAERKFACTS